MRSLHGRSGSETKMLPLDARPEVAVCGDQSLLVDVELCDEGAAGARVAVTPRRKAPILLRQGLEAELGEAQPGRGQDGCLTDREIESPDGQGVGRGGPAQVDVDAAPDGRALHIVLKPAPLVDGKPSRARSVRTVERDRDRARGPRAVTAHLVTRFERCPLVDTEDRAAQQPPRRLAQQLEALQTRLADE